MMSQQSAKKYLFEQMPLPRTLAKMAIPTIVSQLGGLNFHFGGTSLLIAVGVALDTMKQLENQMVMRNYSGFLK